MSTSFVLTIAEWLALATKISTSYDFTLYGDHTKRQPQNYGQQNQMKSTFFKIALATTLFSSSSIYANELLDIKDSQLTTEQKKEIFNQMTDDEIELIDNYESVVNYKALINETKAPDLSYNEKLAIIRSQQKK